MIKIVQPGSGYSPTSRLINFALKRLARRQKYYGFVKKGFTIVGKTSGACATVTDKRLIADNWGDVLGSFFIRNANAKPRPRIRIKSGTKTVKITANPQIKLYCQVLHYLHPKQLVNTVEVELF